MFSGGRGSEERESVFFCLTVGEVDFRFFCCFDVRDVPLGSEDEDWMGWVPDEWNDDDELMMNRKR